MGQGESDATRLVRPSERGMDAALETGVYARGSKGPP